MSHSDDVIAAAERYAEALRLTASMYADDDEDWWRRKRIAARAYAELARVAGRRRISLVRSYLPADRLPCGCQATRWDSGERHHDGREHAERAAYEAGLNSQAPSPKWARLHPYSADSAIDSFIAGRTLATRRNA